MFPVVCKRKKNSVPALLSLTSKVQLVIARLINARLVVIRYRGFESSTRSAIHPQLQWLVLCCEAVPGTAVPVECRCGVLGLIGIPRVRVFLINTSVRVLLDSDSSRQNSSCKETLRSQL